MADLKHSAGNGTGTSATKQEEFNWGHAAFNIVTLLQAARELALPVLEEHDEGDTSGMTSRASRFDALLDMAEREALAIVDADGPAVLASTLRAMADTTAAT